MMELKKEIREMFKEEIQEMVGGVAVGKIVMDVTQPGSGDIFVQILQEELSKLISPKSSSDKKKAMLSQPMAGKSDEEIVATREAAIKELEEKGYEVVNTLFTDEWYSDEAMKKRGVVQIPLCFLAKSLENMSLCHAAYFCKGWENARGCKIEHDAAVAYGLKIIEEV